MASRMEPGQADPSTELVDGVVMSGPLRNFDVSTVTMATYRSQVDSADGGTRIASVLG
jgi:hypothetical protein